MRRPGRLEALLRWIVRVPACRRSLPASGGFLLDVYFRNKVFFPAVRKALSAGRHVTPHCLRHTWASLHMARGTPLKWIQEQGGWTTAKLLLDTYGHFMPSETRGFADAIGAAQTAQNAPPAHPQRIVVSDEVAESVARTGGSRSGVGPSSPIMQADPAGEERREAVESSDSAAARRPIRVDPRRDRSRISSAIRSEALNRVGAAVPGRATPALRSWRLQARPAPVRV